MLAVFLRVPEIIMFMIRFIRIDITVSRFVSVGEGWAQGGVLPLVRGRGANES
jgi:hypothetical protein